MKDLLLGREVREKEGIMLARDRDSWGGILFRVDGRC